MKSIGEIRASDLKIQISNPFFPTKLVKNNDPFNEQSFGRDTKCSRKLQKFA